jgi:hypothetical protein
MAFIAFIACIAFIAFIAGLGGILRFISILRHKEIMLALNVIYLVFAVNVIKNSSFPYLNLTHLFSS